MDTRRGQAQDRIRAAAERLAARFTLPAEQVAALQVFDRDPETRQVMRQEAVAGLLETLVEQTEPKAKKAEK